MIKTFFLALKDYLILLWIYLKVKGINLIEFGKVVIRYYPHVLFAKMDMTLLLSYLFSNPFRLSKHFLAERGEEDVYTYGETPLTTLDLIARTCEITSRDVVFELGCGRGRTCLWLNHFIGCSVVGIDYLPSFIEKGQRIVNLFQVTNVSFRLEDIFQADLKGATVIYLYGTCFSATYIHKLIKRLNELPKGTAIITVSYALTEFQPAAPFSVVKQFPASFTWGEAEVYFQKKNL